MSLWWAKKEQLDDQQIALIEDLPLHQNHLVLGPPGSGKTNVLLRRAQFVRTQGLPNVQVLTFTRALTEFMKTGCYDQAGREIFPPKLITTVESWVRMLYDEHDEELPDQGSEKDLNVWKRNLANLALKFAEQKHLPRFDGIFVDEAQDLLEEEVRLLADWGQTLFFVGDDKQRIFGHSSGLVPVRQKLPSENVHSLEFHYRVAPELSHMADRILRSTGTDSMASTGHYIGPKPGHVDTHGPLSTDKQLTECADMLRQQLRVYSDLINQGDRLGVVVALKKDRDAIFEFFEQQNDLVGKSKITRARSGDSEDDYDPEFGDEPICILTVAGCKGLEFRAVHWLFCERNSHYQSAEHYYTVVTRAKTSLDLYYEKALPPELARAYARQGGPIW